MAEDKPKYYYRITDVPLVPLTDKVGTRFIPGRQHSAAASSSSRRGRPFRSTAIRRSRSW